MARTKGDGRLAAAYRVAELLRGYNEDDRGLVLQRAAEVLESGKAPVVAKVKRPRAAKKKLVATPPAKRVAPPKFAMAPGGEDDDS
jgi:hypothetical protein